MKNRVGDDGVPAILQYRPSDLYLKDRKETMAILQKGTHTPLHICKYGLPSFILLPHKINYSYKCILMLRATHGHLASKNENKRQKNIWTVVRSHDRGHSGQGGLVLVC